MLLLSTRQTFTSKLWTVLSVFLKCSLVLFDIVSVNFSLENIVYNPYFIPVLSNYGIGKCILRLLILRFLCEERFSSCHKLRRHFRLLDSRLTRLTKYSVTSPCVFSKYNNDCTIPMSVYSQMSFTMFIKLCYVSVRKEEDCP